MNTPNPLVPQGSLLEQQKSRGKSNLFIAFFTILTIHVVLFGGLLMQGCKRERPTSVAKEPPGISPLDTNLAPSNLPMPPTNFAIETPPAPPPTTVAPTPPEVPPAGAAKEYAVVKGDSFYKIAKDHGVSMNAVIEANPNVNPLKLKPGQLLQIPAPTPAATAPGATETAGTETGPGVYIVKAGDTLSKIAKNHGTSDKAIRTLNNLKTTRLNIGQKLKLPAPKPSAPPTEPATGRPTNPPTSPSGAAVPTDTIPSALQRISTSHWV